MKSASSQRIFLWSGPRNISTAMMYAFAQRNDTKVFDEPLYGYYLAHNQAKTYHPGAEDIIELMENDGEKVVNSMINNSEKPVLFFKNMTHHLLGLDRYFLDKGWNVILTRDPEEMLPSFDKVIQSPDMKDVGYQMQVELLHYLQEKNLPVCVLDAKSVLENPTDQLEKLCRYLGIPFEEKMLKWEPGPRPEDGIWAKHWYGSVHNSTGFIPYVPKTTAFPKNLLGLLEECRPLYEELCKFRLK